MVAAIPVFGRRLKQDFAFQAQKGMTRQKKKREDRKKNGKVSHL